MFSWPYLSIAISMKHMPILEQVISDAIRTRLGAALREQYDLAEPPGQSRKLESRECARETTEARLYPEVDDSVATLVEAANSKPRKRQA